MGQRFKDMYRTTTVLLADIVTSASYSNYES